jgi:hypothetical protein
MLCNKLSKPKHSHNPLLSKSINFFFNQLYMQGYLQRCDLALVVSFAQGLGFGLDVDKVTFIAIQYMLVVE